MKRRPWLLGTAGLAAAAAGVWWQSRQAPSSAGDAATTAVPLDPAEAAFWAATFSRPDGTDLPMAPLRGRPLVLNFWGSWCPPCVQEMPELDRFHREWAGRGWQVLGLAIDNPKAVREFLARSPVGYTIGLAGFEGSELTRQLGNSAGGLPFTVLFDRRGAAVQRKLGQVHHADLVGWAQAL
jgi:thiol-disulfide isomerase/thioredoxin